MKKHLIIINILLILLTANVGVFTQNKQDNGTADEVKAVESVDLTKYSGKWFEIARYPNKFQKKCIGEVTATYTIKKNNKVEVINECLKKSGKKMKAKGKAKVVDTESNAKLKVRFAPSFLSFLPQVWGKYWILDLDENYQYAVVGDPGKEYLWILSREPKLETATYEEILDKLERMGFNPAKLIKTPQNIEVINGEVITKPQT